MKRETAPITYWFALAGVAEIVIGSFGRWATSVGGTETVNGTDGDGVITLFLVVIALAALGVYWKKRRRELAVGVLVLGIVILGIGIYELVDIRSYEGPEIVEAGWGLYLVVFGSVILGVSSLDLVRPISFLRALSF